jgi:regulation of enolase protein 1 (concanavalin A-like superfamily)
LPLRASSPDPVNGATGVKETPILRWNAGEQAAQHDVFFGTDRDAVANADTTTTGIYRGRQDPNSYTTEALEWAQTYYWRIDEVNTLDPEGLWQGSVWSFTVVDHLIVDDFEPYDDFCNRIFYTWGDGWGHNGDVSCGVPPSGGNGTGSTVGYLAEPYAEQTIVHGGAQSMPFEYLNDGSTGKTLYSETERTFDPPQNWARHGPHDLTALTLWFRGNAGSVGSFSYNPAADIYTMNADGQDIWNTQQPPGSGNWVGYDEFHYAYKRLSGVGTVEAQVLSVANTNGWAKAGVMIRETLDANSVNVMVAVTPGNGVSFQWRGTTGGGSDLANQTGISAPHWVRLTRSGNDFTAEHSTNGATWETLGTPANIPMAASVYVGLALTSHNTGATCRARFSNVTITGTVTGQWQSQDIGITSNDAERLYVALEDSTGAVKDVPHPDPNAVQLDTWQEWSIDLGQFSAAGVNLQSVRKMYIGVGNRNTPTLGGSGTLYVDDIRLYQSRCLPLLAKPAGDFNNNCVVDYPDLDVMTDNWLISDYDVTPVDPGVGNLVAYYALQNNTNDGSGNGHHGDPCGAPTYVPGPAGYGTAMHFDGTGVGNYVDLGTFDPSAATGELTVAVWANWDGLTGYWQGLVAKRDTWSADDMMWQLEADVNSGTLGFFRYGGPYFANGALPVGQWTHVAASFDGTTVSFYVNAELTGSGPFSFGPDTEARVVFGAVEGDGGNPFNGTLDEVRIYDRGLTQGQIAWLAGKTTTYTQPLYLLLTPQDDAIDMNSDGTIDLKDYALLADIFLDQLLWP